ncbi:MAG: ATP-dependent helicase [Vicinamibacterales bacterium]
MLPEQNAADLEFVDIFTGDGAAEAKVGRILETYSVSGAAPLEPFAPEMDEAQRRFVFSESSTIRLLAPAGSGKTQSIANRIVHTVDAGTLARRVLLLTFDNAARATLADRVSTLLKERGHSEIPTVLTLNSYGNGLLRQDLREEVPHLSLGEDLPRHQGAIVRGALKELRKKKPEVNAVLPAKLAASVYCQLFSLLKNEIVTPQSVGTPEGKRLFLDLVGRVPAFRPWIEPWRGHPEGTARVRTALNAIVTLFGRYWTGMRQDGRMDFDDQKLLPYLALSANPGLARTVRAHHDVVIVDEFQDINRLDFALIMLVSEGAELVVVGDDDQAIYAFRGCSPRYIVDFESLSGRPTETCILDINYRSPANVVDLSQRLISHNTNRVNKRSRSRDGAPIADVELWHSVNSASEAQIIARAVKRVISAGKGKVDYGDVAVLFRMNAQSLPLQLALILNEVPYHCRREDNVLLSEAMGRILRLFAVHLALGAGQPVSEPQDAELLYESHFRWNIAKNRERFVALTRTTGHVVAAARQLEQSDSKWTGFPDAIAGLGGRRSAAGVIEYIGQNFRNLRGVVGTLEDAIDGHVPMGELLDLAGRFRGTSGEFLETLQRLTDKAQAGLFATGESDGVNLLTYFRAKGRQWHTVFLPGVNERVIPDPRAQVEDERRLFYVAVTRSTANLVLSYVRTAVREKVTPSRFLAELGVGDARERRSLT